MTKKSPTPADAGRLVRKVADVLNDRGWTRYELIRSNNKEMCLAGAVNFTYCGNAQLERNKIWKTPLLNLTYQLLDHFFVRNTDNSKYFYVTGIEGWNDTVPQSKEEVIAWLHKFADHYDQKKV